MSKLGAAVEARRSELGMTQAELAALSGISQRNVSKIEAGETARPRKWRELASALRIPQKDFATLIDDTAVDLDRPGKMVSRTAIPRNVSQRVREINAPYISVARTPILGRAAAGEPGRLIMMHTEYDSIPTPPELNGVEGGYAVYVYGDSMEPRFYAGELLLVHPHKPVWRGDFCVVQIGSGDDSCGYVKRFVSQDGEKLVLQQLNPEMELSFDSHEVTATHKVVGMRLV